jgi:putative (di)nucleoside polyphosphate hydrolase
MRYLGEDNQINIKTKKPEFLDWKWVDLKEITNLVVDFKLHVYQEVQQKVQRLLVNRS